MNRTIAKKQEADIGFKSYAVLLLLSLIWGTSFILIKKGLVAYTPVQLGNLRIVISGMFFFPFLLYYRRKVDWSKWPFLVIVGLCGSGIPSFLFAIAQTEISSSLAGILNSLTPLFTLIIGVAVFGISLIWSKILGVLLGLSGAVLLILFGHSAGLEGNLWYGLFIVVASVCYAVSVNTVGVYLRDMSPLAISAASFGMIAVPAFMYLAATDFLRVLSYKDGAWEALGYITILALASTVLASLVFFKLVHWTSPVFSSTVAYLIPIVALLWGLLDGEPITYLHLLGMGLILIGVYLSRNRKTANFKTAKT